MAAATATAAAATANGCGGRRVEGVANLCVPLDFN